MWYVIVKDLNTMEEVHRVECKSERSADRVEDGILINISDDHFTEIVEVCEEG